MISELVSFVLCVICEGALAIGNIQFPDYEHREPSHIELIVMFAVVGLGWVMVVYDGIM